MRTHPTWLYGYGRSALRRCAAAALFSLVFLAACAQPDRDNPKTIILGHAMHVTHPVAIAMEHMAERVGELSGGELVVRTYPGGLLGGERELLELAQIGTIGMTKVSSAALENIVPPVQVFSLPYLFHDNDHLWGVLEGEIGRALLDVGAAYRLQGLAYYDAGWRSFYTIGRPILTPADLAGLKIRVQPSIMAMTLVRDLGGEPPPNAYGGL
jgi:TRAP-type C4-dicarboxylate transport system substrate-binding protein